MPMRNGQNPTRAFKFGRRTGKIDNIPGTQGKSGPIAGHCPACSAEVPPKPGFRFSALTCPKCGTSMGKK